MAVHQQSTVSDDRSPSPLFTVRTPTARVADLGTEFGVEVDPSGVSTAHVYEGKVEFAAVAGGGATGRQAGSYALMDVA